MIDRHGVYRRYPHHLRCYGRCVVAYAAYCAPFFVHPVREGLPRLWALLRGDSVYWSEVSTVAHRDPCDCDRGARR